MGSYNITEKLNNPTKFSCMVSFNGEPAHLYEVESFDPVEIDAVLQKVADDHESESLVKQAKADAASALNIVDGKVALK